MFVFINNRRYILPRGLEKTIDSPVREVLFVLTMEDHPEETPILEGQT